MSDIIKTEHDIEVLDYFSDSILINFVPAAHGNFLCNVICWVYALKDLGGPDSTGAWHTYLQNKSTYIGPKIAWAQHAYRWFVPGMATIHCSTVGNKYDYRRDALTRLITKKFINITVKDTKFKALLTLLFPRIGDAVISPSEILLMTQDEFTSTWRVRDAAASEIDTSLRAHLNKQLRDEQFANISDRIINATAHTRLYNVLDYFSEYSLTTIIEQNNQWISTFPPNQVVNFDMSWFYNIEEFMNGINLIGKEFNLTKLVADSDIKSVQNTFISAIKEIPDHMDDIMARFNDNQEISTYQPHLTFNDNLFILTLLKQNSTASKIEEFLTSIP